MAQQPNGTDEQRKPIQIRNADINDAAEIAILGGKVFNATFGHSVEPHEMAAYLEKDYSTAAITKDLEDPDKDTIVATGLNGEILGFGILTRGTNEPCVDDLENTVELQRIYVNTNAHGKGIGGLLRKAIENLAREKGFKNMWLGVWEENFSAMKAYEAWGYKKVGSHDFVIGTVVQTDYIMTKAL
ncbi:acyl-n-acyltransferase protein [Neofusicoccum parvum]|uniref:Acyl-n-acyltransferase protein n=1 Tax=Neofusicoccum parvum TaxID=310453 RepID=A0ACB5S6K9_9PEZI|nr:acyl-n-acyltransferase protein [Neofusicoccum parvum]